MLCEKSSKISPRPLLTGLQEAITGTTGYRHGWEHSKEEEVKKTPDTTCDSKERTP